MKASKLLLPTIVAMAFLSTAAMAQSPPTLSYPVPPPDVTSAGDTSYEFTFRYSDDGQIVTSTIDNNDVRVSGPGGFNVPCTVVSFKPSTTPFANSPVDATYRFTPPGGSWDPADNGTYQLIMQPNQVTDRLGQPIESGVVATFKVEIAGGVPPTPPAQPLNIATRLRVQTGENVMIGGFIVSGNAPKRIIVRAIGPSLQQAGITNALSDPVVELRGADGALIASNDDWRHSQEAELQASGVAPQNDKESALIATLASGNHTATVSGKNGTAGVGLVEVYDLDAAADARLANLSTRGFVETGTDVMIGGFILGNSNESARVVLRAIGPSLAQGGVNGALADPTLQLFNGNGDSVAFNNNWRDSQQAELEATTIPPSHTLEAAIVATLPPGPYTAVVSGNGGVTGVGLVELYHLK